MCANYNGERRREHSRRKILSCFAIGNLHTPAFTKKKLGRMVDEARFGYCTYISIPYFYVAFPAINERAGTQTRIKSIINHKRFYLFCVGAP